MHPISVSELTQFVRASAVIEALYGVAEQAGFEPDQCDYPFERLVALATLVGITNVADLEDLAKEHASKIEKLLRKMKELHNPKDGAYRVQKAFMAEPVIIFARRDIVDLHRLLVLGWGGGACRERVEGCRDHRSALTTENTLYVGRALPSQRICLPHDSIGRPVV